MLRYINMVIYNHTPEKNATNAFWFRTRSQRPCPASAYTYTCIHAHIYIYQWYVDIDTQMRIIIMIIIQKRIKKTNSFKIQASRLTNI
jgi:hypothetical protein